MRFSTCIVIAFILGIALQISDVSPWVSGQTAKDEKMLRAVFHINFADGQRQEHGLKNMENILKAVGKAEIEVVCHGEGINLVIKDQNKHAEKVAKLQKQGVHFVACENTLKQKALKKENLLEGVTTVPSGAVEILRKQGEGYGYFRP